MHKYFTGTWLVKTNQFNHNFEQLAALLASCQKLVTKTEFWPVCSKQAVASKQKDEWRQIKTTMTRNQPPSVEWTFTCYP